jgi:hypothetical protein
MDFLMGKRRSRSIPSGESDLSSILIFGKSLSTILFLVSYLFYS